MPKNHKKSALEQNATNKYLTDDKKWLVLRVSNLKKSQIELICNNHWSGWAHMGLKRDSLVFFHKITCRLLEINA